MTDYLTLGAVIRQKLAELGQIVDRITTIRQRIETTEDEFYLDAIALNLHSFYTCLEQIFEAIARTIGEGMPTGTHWHQQLLLQMSVAVPTVRPAVISQASRRWLDTYRSFRHVVRNG
ncbi:ribonuclease toxin HepT-like protein [Trichothermofontia sp.]